MTVEDVFFIRGRGTVAAVRIERGPLNIHDEIYLSRSNSSRRVTVNGIEILRKLFDQAKAGDNIGVLFRNISKQEVEKR